MRYIIGISPSIRSKKDEYGLAQPWCPGAGSGRKVRLLSEKAAVEFANATDEWQGTYSTSKGEEKHKNPPRRTGLEFLERLRSAHQDTNDLTVLLLGLGYWGDVAEMACKGHILRADGGLKAYERIEFVSEAGDAFGAAYLVDHPRDWPTDKEHDCDSYRAAVISTLASGGEKTVARIDRTFKALGI